MARARRKHKTKKVREERRWMLYSALQALIRLRPLIFSGSWYNRQSMN
jgi:hypothetical protein